MVEVTAFFFLRIKIMVYLIISDIFNLVKYHINFLYITGLDANTYLGFYMCS